MSSGLPFRSQRYSRPASLSTISSNEEADFSHSRRNRQTFQSSYSVSPLDESLPNNFHHPAASAPAEPNHAHTTVKTELDSPVSTTHDQAHELSESYHDRSLKVAAHSEQEVSDDDLEQPKPTLTRSSLFNLPEMDRSGDVEALPQVKYMTRYMWMLLQLDQIPAWHNLLAALSAWIVLAAYLVVPNTFTSLQKNNAVPSSGPTPGASNAGFKGLTDQIVKTVDHLGLLIFSGILASVGVFFSLLLFFMHWPNYVWLSMKIFQPMMLNALAGLVTTIVNVELTQKGVWSPVAKLNAIVTGGVTALAGSLFLLYNFVLLRRIKAQHRKYFPVDVELLDPMKANRFNQKIGKFLPPDQRIYR